MKRVVLLSVIVGVGACTGTASGTHDMPGASNPLVGYVADCGDAPSSFLAEPAIAVYTASQQAALWCLKKLAAPGSGFKVISYPEGTGAPTWIQMEGEVDLGGTNEEAPQSFVTKYGPLVGAVFDVNGGLRVHDQGVVEQRLVGRRHLLQRLGVQGCRSGTRVDADPPVAEADRVRRALRGDRAADAV
jgi:hypothetical protein